MSKRHLDALFRGAAGFRAGVPVGGEDAPPVCGGFGGFGGVPGHMRDMLAAQGLHAVEVGPDQFEVVPMQERGESPPRAA